MTKEMEVKIKQLDDGAILPYQSTPGSGAYDLSCPKEQWIPRGRGVIKLGFAMELPEGIGAFIFARSGNEAKGMSGWQTENSETDSRFENFDVKLGLADEDYRGEVGVLYHNYGEPFIIDAGQRIAQMAFIRTERPSFVQVEELSETERGEGGIGHTGK